MRKGVWVVGLLIVCSFAALAQHTITVPDDYPTIQAAIDAAQPGDTVYVKAGTYEERIILKSGITLRGEGRDVTTITYSGDAPVVTVENASAVTIIGFTIHYLYLGAGTHSTISVVSSRFSITHCTITGAKLAGIQVKGSDSDVVIANNVIRGNINTGIHIHEATKVTVRQNEIHGNDGVGVTVSGAGANPLIEGNIVHDNAWDGILIWEGAQGMVCKNEIYGNGYDGIAVQDEGTNPLIEDNIIHDNPLNGVSLSGAAQAKVLRNKIYGNSQDGIEVTDEGTNPLIEDNVIHDNTYSGIFIYKGAQGTVRENEIYKNGHGIAVKDEGTEAEIAQNMIVLNVFRGIWVLKKARAKVTDNTIALNGGGIDVQGYSYGSAGSVVASGNNVWGNGCPEYRGLDVPADDTSTPFPLEDYPALQTKLAYIRLGWVYYRQGLYEKALSALKQAEQVKELGESEDRIDLDLGGFHLLLGHDQAAEDYWSKVLDKDPKNVSALIDLGWLRFLQGKYDEALDLTQRASEEAEKGSLDKAFALNNLGYVYFAMGDNKEAIELLLKALQEAPDDKSVDGVRLAVFAHSVLGRAYEALGEMDKAREHFQQAIKAAESVLSCYNFDRDLMVDVGFSYLGLGEVEKGKEYLRKALKLSLGDRAGDTIAAMVINKLLGQL